jgi:GntR family transcriptional regulator
MAQQQPPPRYQYQAIADKLRHQIESGELPRDSRLPTEAELQEKFGASRNTVREALKLLVAERLLETRGGREGTWITKAHTPFVTTLSTDPTTGLSGGGEEGATYPALVLNQGREGGAGTPEVQVLECPRHIAARLLLDEHDSVVRRHQQRFIEGIVWSLQTSYYPMKWVEMGALGLLKPTSIPEGTIEYLANAIGLKQVGYRDLTLARLPNEQERALFELTHSHTVLEVYRTSFAEDGTPIRVTVTVYPSDRNQIVHDVGTVPNSREEPVPV